MGLLGVAITMSTALLVAANIGQEAYVEGATSFQGVRGRVVIPDHIEVDEAVALRVLAALENQKALARLPGSMPADQFVTITVVPSPYPERDGWSFPETAVIALPVERVALWTEGELYRIVRHELVHIVLGNYVGRERLPTWFREGFAEWVAGGLSCEARARLHMNLILQRSRNEAPSLTDPQDSSLSRRDYDLFTSFFEFLERRSPGLMASGELLSEIKARGFSAGMLRAAGTDLHGLEREWQRHLSVEYTETDIPRCQPGRS